MLQFKRKVPHLTVYEIPLLQTLVYAWMWYAIFAFFYFSVDWLSGRSGRHFRLACHAAATLLEGYYVIYILWYIPITYFALVWIPPWDWLQSICWILVAVVLIILEWQFLDSTLIQGGVCQTLRQENVRSGQVGSRLDQIENENHPALEKLVGRVVSIPIRNVLLIAPIVTTDPLHRL